MSKQSDGDNIRKHFYLVTEHKENEGRIGRVSIMDNRMSRPLKNEEGPITILDDDKKEFRKVGKQVGMGYHDFESQEAYEDNERCSEVMKQKLAEIDKKWLQKAGLDPNEVLPQ
jgi:hypothetical protein